jgi:hypothetical protein
VIRRRIFVDAALLKLFPEGPSQKLRTLRREHNGSQSPITTKSEAAMMHHLPDVTESYQNRRTQYYYGLNQPVGSAALRQVSSLMSNVIFLSSLLFHDRDISVGLVSYHLPASPEARQNRGFGPTLRHKHETVKFLGLSPATTRFVDLSLRAKKGQRRPPKYSKSKETNPRALRLQRLSGLERPSAWRLEA